ncbi:MAG: glycoside hydrolase family 15 protein [Candidatus Binatia bacterium]
MATDYVANAFRETVAFWRRWVGRSSYRGRWREMVNRSAVTLKLLTSSAYGSIVASPTFGLPERVGGQRNWDYRFTRIRDASFTLYGLMRLGYTEEAAALMRWVEARCEELEPDGSLQIMFGIDGRHQLLEETLPHLEGYMGSAPVRIVFTNFWDAKRRAFTQSKGSAPLDASALLMPLVRFVSPTDPRWVATLRAMERELVSDSLVYRYRLGDAFSDGLFGDEGTFSMWSFWYVECLSRLGDLEQERFYFEKMLGYASAAVAVDGAGYTYGS